MSVRFLYIGFSISLVLVFGFWVFRFLGFQVFRFEGFWFSGFLDRMGHQVYRMGRDARFFGQDGTPGFLELMF